jgi:hypothetical protein
MEMYRLRVKKIEINGRGDPLRCSANLAPNSPKNGGHSVGIVRLQTKYTVAMTTTTKFIDALDRNAKHSQHENTEDSGQLHAEDAVTQELSIRQVGGANNHSVRGGKRVLIHLQGV